MGRSGLADLDFLRHNTFSPKGSRSRTSLASSRKIPLCSDKEVQAKHGKRMAEKIQQRLAELQAAEMLADMRDLPAAYCHELAGNFAGMLAVNVVHPDRLRNQ